MTTILGSIIIGQLMLAALSRYNIPENRRRQFNLYAEEFSYFATPAMGILLTQARKYKIATTVATQVLTQMSETIQATVLQAGSKIVFAVTPPDAEILSGVFDTTPALSQQYELTEQIGEFPIQYCCIDIYESRARRFLEKVAVYLGFPTYLSLMYEFTTDESVRPLTPYELQVNQYEKDLYQAFIHTFTLAVKALHADPIYVDPPKELPGSQTFIDRRKAIENILTHLGVGEAMVKTPAGEWLIHTKPGEGIQGDFDEKKEQVIENTRERYGKTREEVDHTTVALVWKQGQTSLWESSTNQSMARAEGNVAATCSKRVIVSWSVRPKDCL